MLFHNFLFEREVHDNLQLAVVVVPATGDRNVDKSTVDLSERTLRKQKMSGGKYFYNMYDL